MNWLRLQQQSQTEFRRRKRGHFRAAEFSGLDSSQLLLQYRAILHLMRNHLQLVASLLRLESQAVAATSHSKNLLEQTIERLHAVGLAHELLNETDITVDVPQYLRNLSLRLVRGHPKGEQITCAVDADAIALPLDLIVKLGLIVCEVMVRTLASAPSDDNLPHRELTIACRFADHQCRLIFADNQPGLAINSNLGDCKIPLIEMLSKQLQGSVTVEQGDFGSVWILSFPIERD